MSFIRKWIQKLNSHFNYEWDRVPVPNWRCSRGGRDYW